MSFTALPVVTMKEGHVTVDFLQSLANGTLEVVRKILVYLSTAFAFGTLAYVLYKQADKLAFMEMKTPHLHLPEDLIVYFLFAMAVIAALLVWDPLQRAVRKGTSKAREK